MNLAKIADAIPMACVVIDADDRIVAANERATRLLGAGLVGRNYGAMLRQPRLLEAIAATINDKVERHIQYARREMAHDTTIRATCSWIDDGAGALMVCFEDLTEVEHASQMRRDFVANVSHELRTPLTSITGFIETLRGPAKDDPKARDRFLGIMEAEATRMNRLVGDLLSLSRVESDERVRPTTTISLRDVLQSTIHRLQPVAERAEVSLTSYFDVEDVTLTTDFDQLIQVFSNLLENAIKYGGSGEEVCVTLYYTPRDAGLRGPAARVQVIDNGPGIDPVHLPRLTERFYRADNHRSRELGGTGLGLAIVKHIINRHRGRLRVQSVPGQGATFTVILPCQQLGDT